MNEILEEFVELGRWLKNRAYPRLRERYLPDMTLPVSFGRPVQTPPLQEDDVQAAVAYVEYLLQTKRIR